MELNIKAKNEENKEKGTITFKKLKDIVAMYEANNAPDDMELSFERIIGLLFPLSLDYMREMITQSYIEGYNAGKAEPKN